MRLERIVSIIGFIIQKTLNEEEFRARVYEFDMRKKAKIQQMQAEMQDKDIEGCTFQPVIYSVEEGYQKRNLNQFLEDQNNFVRKVHKKLEEKREQASHQEDGLMHPQIDETSRMIVETKLAEKRGDAPIHERLYGLNKELQSKKKQMREIEDLNFKAQTVENNN